MVGKNGEQALIIFIKNPKLGQIKTRLAKTVGDQRALEIYLQLLAHTRKVSEQVEASRYLYYSDWINSDDDWDTNKFIKKLQHSGDLGQRIKNAFQDTLTLHSKVIIIGSDCIELTSDMIQKAFTQLDHCDVVIGPTHDGGYYLLGIKSFHEFLFTDIPWSSGLELKETFTRAVAMGLKTVLLPRLSDIDYYEDWVRSGMEKS